MNQMDIDRLKEIRDEMEALFDEAKTLLRHNLTPHQYAVIKHTWIANLDVALGEGSFIDKYENTFKKTIDALVPDVEEEELENEESDDNSD